MLAIDRRFAPRQPAQRFTNARNAALRNDDVAKLTAGAAGHRVDALTKIRSVAAHCRTSEQRHREQGLARRHFTRLGCGTPALLHLRLPAEPAPDAEYVEKRQDDIRPSQCRL